MAYPFFYKHDCCTSTMALYGLATTSTTSTLAVLYAHVNLARGVISSITTITAGRTLFSTITETVGRTFPLQTR